jgi:DNA-binding MarR family transcriptional regulator
MKRYVKNLIDSYNGLVDEYDEPRPDFNIIKGYFSLYHDVGNSFKVIVIQTDPYHANQISLIFIPIRAEQPDVSMNYNDTFGTMFPNMSETLSFLTIQENLPFTYNGTVVRQDLVLGIQAADVSGDYMTDSSVAANAIYQQDQSKVPTVSQTQTVIQTMTTSVQSIQNHFGYIILGAIGGVILLGIGIVVTYFGSGKDFVKFLTDERERKGVMGDLKKLFRLLIRRNKKKRAYTSSARNVSEINREILSTLLRKGPLRAIVLSNKIDLDVTSTVLHLTQLEKDGFVVATHSVLGRYWSVTTKGKDLFKLKI